MQVSSIAAPLRGQRLPLAAKSKAKRTAVGISTGAGISMAITLKTGTLSELMSHVDMKPKGCHIWKRHVEGSGYGQVYFQGKHTQAHRFLWQLLHGPLTANSLVCHTCDNRRCLNPNHLFIGTHQDNSDDKMNKGRSVSSPGQRNGNVKLTPWQVGFIRHIGHSISYAKMAPLFGVTPEMISLIVNNKNWKEGTYENYSRSVS